MKFDNVIFSEYPTGVEPDADFTMSLPKFIKKKDAVLHVTFLEYPTGVEPDAYFTMSLVTCHSQKKTKFSAQSDM